MTKMVKLFAFGCIHQYIYMFLFSFVNKKHTTRPTTTND